MSEKQSKFLARVGFLLLALMCIAAPAIASEFRLLNPIRTPQNSLPKGAEEVDQIRPVDRDLVRLIMEKLFSAWNGPDLTKLLSETFFDRLRLEFKMTEIPRDAKLRLLGLQGMQTLNQHIMKNPKTGKKQVVSRVSVTARTQIEFNDLQLGFQRIPGTNEYVLQVKQNLKN